MRITWSGVAVLTMLAVSASVALSVGSTDRYPLFVLALFLAAFVLVQYVFGTIWEPRVRIERALPERCAALATVPVRARVTNVGRLRCYDLAVNELQASPPLEIEGSPYTSVLEPGESVELVYTIKPPHRGSFELRGPIAQSGFPFGLHHAIRHVKHPARILVYPRFSPLKILNLPVAAKHQPGGLSLVSNVGDSGEYIGNRDYRAGDRLRDLHHAAWARLGRPVVREYREEYLCRVALICDTHVPRGSARQEAALEAAISFGASVAEVLSRQEYVVDVFAAGPDLYHFQAGRSLAYLDNILDILACLEPCRANPFDTLAPALAAEVQQISTAVTVLLDWDEARARFVRSLQENGVAVKVVIVREGPTTADPSGFTSEAGPAVVVTPKQVAEGVAEL